MFLATNQRKKLQISKYGINRPDREEIYAEIEKDYEIEMGLLEFNKYLESLKRFVLNRGGKHIIVQYFLIVVNLRKLLLWW